MPKKRIFLSVKEKKRDFWVLGQIWRQTLKSFVRYSTKNGEKVSIVYFTTQFIVEGPIQQSALNPPAINSQGSLWYGSIPIFYSEQISEKCMWNGKKWPATKFFMKNYFN